MKEGRGRKGERLSVREEGRGGESELGSDMDLNMDPDPWKILRIWIQQNYVDPSHSDPDPNTDTTKSIC